MSIGTDVTVNGEHYVGQDVEKIKINVSSFWARVVSHIGGDNDVYQVEDECGTVGQSTILIEHYCDTVYGTQSVAIIFWMINSMTALPCNDLRSRR